jgi:PAS domain S-box-containing protein
LRFFALGRGTDLAAQWKPRDLLSCSLTGSGVMTNKTQNAFAVVLLCLWIGLSAARPLTAGDEGSVVRIGVLANRGSESCLARWTPTAQYLTEKIPGKTFQIVPVDFEQIYWVVSQGAVEFILANPAFFVELESWYRVNPIATLRNRFPGGDSTRFAGVIFTRADRIDLRSLRDLKGKRFAAVKETSLGGWLMAWREFFEINIDPNRDFASLVFAGTQDAVVNAVIEGRADAGAVRSDILERMAAEGRIRLDQFRVFPHPPGDSEEVPFLHSTRAYPEWPMAEVRHTDDELARQVAVALLQMSADSPAARAADCAGWAIPLNYQSVHECLKVLKVGPYKDLGRITAQQAMRAFWQWILAAFAGFVLMGGGTFIIFMLYRRLAVSNDKLHKEAGWRQQASEALKESEQFNRTILSSVADGLMVYDSDFRYRLWNWRMEELTGLCEADVIGRTPWDLFPHLREEGIDRLLERALAGETVFSPDTKFHIPRTGRSGWVVGSYTPHVSASGQIIGVVGAITDITARKTVERELVSSNERFRAVMDGLDAMVYVADMTTHELLYANQYGLQTWGEVIGKICWQVLQCGQTEPCGFCTNARLLDAQGTPTGIYVWECQNTVNQRWYECRDQAIRWTDGRYVRLEIATDITERKSGQDQVLRHNRFLHDVLESLTHPFMVVDADDYSVQIANSAAGTHCQNCKCYHLTHRSEEPCCSQEHPCPVEIIKQTGKPAVVEHVHYDRHGDLRNVEVHGYPIFDEEGRISQVIEYSLDITDRKRAEIELQEKEEYLRTMMATIQTGVLISELLSGRITDVNPFAARLIGEDAGTLIGQPWTHCLEEASDQDEAGQNGRERADARLHTAQGKALSVRLSKAEVCIRDQCYKIHSFLDISDIRELFEQQAVNIELAKGLLDLVNPRFSRNHPIDERLGLHIEAISLPCRAAGGDHFFVRRLSGGDDGSGPATYLSVKDQSGHEVNCVLRSIFTDLVHNAVLQHDDTSQFEGTIQLLNDRLVRGGMFAEEDFLTGIFARIDHSTLYMQYAACGHPPFLLIRDGDVVSLPQAGGLGQNLPLGAIADVRISTGRIRLRVGDKVLFYTDGLTEMPLEKHGSKLSRSQLEDLVSDLVRKREVCRVSELMRDLMDAVAHLSGQRVQYPDTNTSADDVTLVGLEVEDLADVRETVVRPRTTEELCEQIRDISESIAPSWQSAGLADSRQRVRTVLEEALLNAWQHGHRGQPDKPITIRWRAANDFHLEVVDTGEGFDPDFLSDPTLPKNRLSISGRGIYMIRMFADEVQWRDAGRRLTASFFRHSGRVPALQRRLHQDAVPFWRLSNQ